MFFLWLSIQTIMWVGSGTLFVMTDHQYLPGLCEITNAAEGYNVINKPIAIGANNRLIGMRQEAQS